MSVGFTLIIEYLSATLDVPIFHNIWVFTIIWASIVNKSGPITIDMAFKIPISLTLIACV
jgi:hypothetical protein